MGTRRRDACLGRGTRGREAWNVGTGVWGEVGTWGRGEVGTWGLAIGDFGTWDVGTRRRGDAGTRDRGGRVVKIGDARLGAQGGEKQKELFSALNEYKIQFAVNPRWLVLRGTV